MSTAFSYVRFSSLGQADGSPGLNFEYQYLGFNRKKSGDHAQCCRLFNKNIQMTFGIPRDRKLMSIDKTERVLHSPNEASVTY